jgi:DNA-binding FadR family transcriptional regulator
MTASDLALDRLRVALDRGDYAAGARLPPERELAGILSVGRGTLRKALDMLEREGRIRRRVGQGTFVTARRLDAALRLDAPPTPADVMETRMIVEPAIAAAAAIRARAPDLEKLTALATSDVGEDWRAWETLDNAFHTGLAAASGNPLLAGLLDTLHEMRRRDEWGRLRRRTLTPEREKLYRAQHAAVLEAVTRRDPAEAAAAMRRHIAAVQAAMIDGVEPETGAA